MSMVVDEDAKNRQLEWLDRVPDARRRSPMKVEFRNIWLKTQ